MGNRWLKPTTYYYNGLLYDDVADYLKVILSSLRPAEISKIPLVAVLPHGKDVCKSNGDSTIEI